MVGVVVFPADRQVIGTITERDQLSMMIWASRSEWKIPPFNSSSRIRPLKLSQNPVSQGAPGSMDAV